MQYVCSAVILQIYLTVKLPLKDRLYWGKKIFTNQDAGTVHNYRKRGSDDNPFDAFISKFQKVSSTENRFSLY